MLQGRTHTWLLAENDDDDDDDDADTCTVSPTCQALAFTFMNLFTLDHNRMGWAPLLGLRNIKRTNTKWSSDLPKVTQQVTSQDWRWNVSHQTAKVQKS